MKYLLILIIIILTTTNLFSKKVTSVIINNTSDTCANGPKLWFIDDNQDNLYDNFIYGGCHGNAKSFELIDKSQTTISTNEKAVLVQGGIFTDNFLIYLLDSIYSNKTHKIYYDASQKKVILEDIAETDKNNTYTDEADNYFSTYISGSHIRLIKKTDIYIKAMKLCNIEGMVLDNKPVFDNQSEYIFDLFGNPAGMYFIWIQSSDKVFVMKIIYLGN